MLNTIFEVRAIEEYELDDPSAADSFSRRLARENGWSPEYAARVAREYKRFVALAVVAPHTVTPSDQVDQAWHLHLQDTAHYWRFCQEVLGRPLDHHPSRGGPDERAKYIHAYEETRRAYSDLFGEPPPGDIWPDSERRFGADLLQRRVNLAENWVIPNTTAVLRFFCRRSRVTRWLVALAGLAGLSFALESLVLRGLSGGAVFLLLAVGFVSSLAVPLLRGRRREPVTELVPRLTPVQAAYLSSGSRRALDCSLTKLLIDGALKYDAETRSLRAVGRLASNADLVERRIHAEVTRSEPAPVTGILARAREWTGQLRAELSGHGLLAKKRALPLFVAALFPALSLVHVLRHAGAESPWPWLLFAGLTTYVAFRNFWPSGARSADGDRALRELKRAYPPPPKDELNPAPALTTMTAFNVALFGGGMLAQTELMSFGDELASHVAGDADPSDPSDSGGDGGCGDGGDGGGCGGGCGCGGCGGCG